MKIKELKIKNFRNISEMCFVPNEEINIIYGENAQGKTNMTEAVWLFTGAKSFRGAKDVELKKIGEENCVLNLTFETGMVEKEEKIIALLEEITERIKKLFGEKFNI